MSICSTDRGRIIWSRVLPITLLLTILCVVAAWALLETDKGADGGSRLEIEQKYLDLGEQWETHRLAWPIVITNRGRVELPITMLSSCGCAAIEPPAFTLPPGTSQQIKLMLNLAGGSRAAMARDWSMELAARVDKNHPALTVWKINGKIRRSLSFSDDRVHLGDRILRGTRSEPKVVEVTACAEATTLRAESTPPLAVQVRKHAETPNTYLVELRTNRDLPSGVVDGKLVVQAVGAKGESRGSRIIFFHGIVTEEVQAVPASVDFGLRALGELAEEIVLLRSVSGKAFEVEKIEAARKTISVERLPARVSGSLAFRIRARTVSEGPNNERVTFLVKMQEDNALIQLPLTVTSHGVRRSGNKL